MTTSRIALIGTLLAALLAGAAPAQEAAIDWSAGASAAVADTALVKPRNFGRAALEVFGVNAAVWTYDRFIREGGTNHVFRVGFDSWAENLSAAWTWDDNSFSTNQFAHPYHGNLYYNAARSNGYSYWESVPFAFAGSYMWEFFGETHNPSLNDWIATSVGGSALGEIFHRLATTVRDNTATGSARNWREMGGLLVDPVGGLNPVLDGEWGRQHANPPDRFPKNFASRMDLGLRTRGEERLWEADTTDVFVEFEFAYGDPFFGDLGKPYDNFDFELQLNFGDKTSIGRVEGSGNLAGVFLKEAPAASHILGAFHRYDYLNTNALEFGGQSVTAGLESRFANEAGLELRTSVQVGPLLLAGASSDYASVSARDYDFGPGLAARVAAEFGRGGWSFLQVSHEQFWLHAISGNVVDHYVSFTRLRATLPLKFNIGFSAEYTLSLAEREYRDYPDVSVRQPQMRAALTWLLD